MELGEWKVSLFEVHEFVCNTNFHDRKHVSIHVPHNLNTLTSALHQPHCHGSSAVYILFFTKYPFPQQRQQQRKQKPQLRCSLEIALRHCSSNF